MKFFASVAKDRSVWRYPASNEKRFKRWFIQYNKGIVGKLMKHTEFKKLKFIYTKTSIGREIKKEHNKNKKDKHTLDKFFKDVKKLVKIELLDDDFNVVELNNWHINPSEISIRVIGECPLKDVARLKSTKAEDIPSDTELITDIRKQRVYKPNSWWRGEFSEGSVSVAKLYYIKLTSGELIAYKIGVTSAKSTICKISEEINSNIKVEILKEWEFSSGEDALVKRHEVAKEFKRFVHPKGELFLKKAGKTEIFYCDVLGYDFTAMGLTC